MKSLNEVILIGRLGKDPDYRTTQSGNVATLSLATSRSYKQGEEWKEDTQWHTVVIWRELADRIGAGQYPAKKGDMLLVKGEIRYRTYQDQSGQTKYFTEIQAYSCAIWERYKPAETSAQPQAAAGNYPPPPARQAAPAAAPQQQYAAPQQAQPRVPQLHDIPPVADNDLPF